MNHKQILQASIALLIVIVFGVTIAVWAHALGSSSATPNTPAQNTLSPGVATPWGEPTPPAPLPEPAEPTAPFNPGVIADHLALLSKAAKAENVAAAHNQCRILQTMSEEQRDSLAGEGHAVWQNVMDDLYWATDACLENNWDEMGKYLDSVTTGTNALVEAGAVA